MKNFEIVMSSFKFFVAKVKPNLILSDHLRLLLEKRKKKKKSTNLVSRVNLKNVGPPTRFFAAGALDEGHTFGRGHCKAVRMSSDILCCSNFQDTGHVDPRLWHSFRLENIHNQLLAID